MEHQCIINHSFPKKLKGNLICNFHFLQKWNNKYLPSIIILNKAKEKKSKKIKSENSNPIEKIHNTTDSFPHYLVGDETDRTLLSISIHPMFPCFLAFDCHINHSV